MTDNEMLELAAKAAGIVNTNCYSEPIILQGGKYWNPLADDGDALRLANDLNISVLFDCCMDDSPIVTTKTDLGEVTRCNFPDPYAATRLAITRAAAGIGKAMP